MVRTSSTRRNGRRLPLTVGTLALLGLLLAPSNVSAQPKKAEKTDIPVPSIPGIYNIDKINELVEKNWEANKLTPSARCSDFEFIRRASLDIIGRIATVDEIRTYMSWKESERRSKLIERLVELGEFNENFANLWTVLLLTRTGSRKLYQEQMKDWLAEALNHKVGDQEEDEDGKIIKEKKETKGPPVYDADWSKIARRLIAATGKTNENPAVNFVLHHMGEDVAPNERNAMGRYDMVPVTSRTTRLFAGLRTQCTQCHDHPFNTEWGQQHFWGINAFFRQTAGVRPPMMAAKKNKELKEAQLELRDEPGVNTKAIVSYERRSGVLLYIDPTFLDGKKIKSTSKLSRRKELAGLITKSPYFSKAYVNRMWGHFFGKSFTKDAIDDFGEHNPVTNEELLDTLAKEWAEKYNHNPRVLVRWICNSKAYGLSSVANKTNDKPEDEVFFARMLQKPMTPEQMFESMMTATAVQSSKTERMETKERWLDKLVQNFGNDEGEEGSFSGTIVQALILMNGEDINKAISDEKVGTVAAVLKKRAFSRTAASDAINDLFLAALNRPATKAEIAKFTDPKVLNLPRVPSAPSNQQTFWTRYYQDIFWAVLNSNEFILNH
ncbi:MAG: DUF1549 and DUF1553 domain-containing protein [Gemmataceae bacterium]|nr:DUF1549 and DUF1553 domain-containing protein [Gemmataceae bacterium]